MQRLTLGLFTGTFPHRLLTSQKQSPSAHACNLRTAIADRLRCLTSQWAAQGSQSRQPSRPLHFRCYREKTLWPSFVHVGSYTKFIVLEDIAELCEGTTAWDLGVSVLHFYLCLLLFVFFHPLQRDLNTKLKIDTTVCCEPIFYLKFSWSREKDVLSLVNIYFFELVINKRATNRVGVGISRHTSFWSTPFKITAFKLRTPDGHT